MERGAAARSAPGAMRELIGVWLRVLLAAGLVAVILAVSGGFGTSVLTMLPRMAYWLGLTALGTTLGIAAARLIVPRAWFDRRTWWAWALIAACITVPMTAVVAMAEVVAKHRPFDPRLLLDVFPGTLATTAGMTALAFLVRRRGTVETHAAAAGAPPPKFLERLPPKLAGAEVWAVEAQDHYLRLHTSLGQDLILMRLSDAILELEGIEGAQTHRSWWVARGAVSEATRGDGRATLTLKNGAEAPVSRAYAKRLREAGWF